MLIMAAQGQRQVMFADIAMRKALNAGKPGQTSNAEAAAEAAGRVAGTLSHQLG